MKSALLFCLLTLGWLVMPAQEEVRRNRPGGNYLFTIEKEIPVNAVEDQGKTSTCWSFSALSFLESELMRMGKGSHDFSEMYIVRHTYAAKADRYVRMHGQMNFGPGGAFHDVPQVIAQHGLVPEEVYDGLSAGADSHHHAEMDALLKALVDAVVKNPGRSLSPRWRTAFAALLDVYLGPVPETFDYQGQSYTPQEFAAALGLDPAAYVELTSYTHHPSYQEFVLEVPDNWNWSRVHNLPLDELIATIDHALAHDYTVAWAADVSEKTFSWANGVAVVPETSYASLSAEAREALFDRPQPERIITPEMRQAAFDNYQTTDDHGMHIVGTARDQHGSKYYLVKNSWGESNSCGGYLYASEAYVRYKTMDIMVHRDAIPKRLRKQLGL